MCVSIIVGVIIGSIISSNLFPTTKIESKIFSENGMSITLTNEFKEYKTEQYTYNIKDKKLTKKAN